MGSYPSILATETTKISELDERRFEQRPNNLDSIVYVENQGEEDKTWWRGIWSTTEYVARLESQQSPNTIRKVYKLKRCIKQYELLMPRFVLLEMSFPITPQFHHPPQLGVTLENKL